MCFVVVVVVVSMDSLLFVYEVFPGIILLVNGASLYETVHRSQLYVMLSSKMSIR